MSANSSKTEYLPLQVRLRLKREEEMLRRQLDGKIVVRKSKGNSEAGYSDRRMGRYSRFLSDHVKEDQNILQGRLRKIGRVLASGTPPPLSSKQKVDVEKKMRVQREWLRSHMCPKKLYHVKASDQDFKRAVKACQHEASPAFSQVATEYQNNVLRVDPDASNIIESIRPD